MKFIRVFVLFALPLYLISCGTQKRNPYYLQNLVDTSGKGNIITPELHIQKNDLLSIQVYSLSTKPELSDVLYNLPCNGTSGGQAGSANTCGYLVDANGNIEYPRLGTFHVEGLTKQELAAQIKKRLTEPKVLLENPNVIIRFLNFKVTVIGEVTTQGVQSITGERATILEVIGTAGGITYYGKKNAVKIIREVDGKREIGIIDLSSKEVFESPYFNLKQNDVVLVEPTKQKTNSAEQAEVTQKISFALTLTTVAATLYNIFSRRN